MTENVQWNKIMSTNTRIVIVHIHAFCLCLFSCSVWCDGRGKIFNMFTEIRWI